MSAIQFEGRGRGGQSALNAPVVPLKLPKASLYEQKDKTAKEVTPYRNRRRTKTKPGSWVNDVEAEKDQDRLSRAYQGKSQSTTSPAAESPATESEESDGPPYARGPAPTRPAVNARPGAGKEVTPSNPNLHSRQWVRVERMDQPNPSAHPMPVPRTGLPGGHRYSVMPHPSDAAVNREPGQMTMFPDLPHSQPRGVPDLGMHGPHPEPYTGGFVAQPGGMRQDQPEGTQGYLFRDKTDKEQARSAVAKSRQKSQKAWEDS